MRLLLDTNAFLRQLGASGNSKLGPVAVQHIQGANAVYVSSISLVEIHIKSMLGKLDMPADCQKVVLEAGNQLLEFSAGAADAIRQFPTLSRHDPFDRMLLAQASSEGLALMTTDRALIDLGLSYVINARV